nr:helix-turn-helix transcriptional regulator [uncultured Sphingosinicella sp.]
MQDDIIEAQSKAVAQRVREELARRRLSRQWLADEARISISTLEKALAGRRSFTLGTVVRLEDALKMKLRDSEPATAPAAAAPSERTGLAPDDLGAYARPAVQWLEGRYLTLRPSLDEPGAIYAYITVINWDDEACHLRFAEASRLDAEFTQQGLVSFPYLSGHIYLVTNFHGQHRMIVLGRPTIQGTMNGVLTTLVVGTGSQLTPAASPICLTPWRGEGEPVLGIVRPGSACYDDYRTRVADIAAKRFALFPSAG